MAAETTSLTDTILNKSYEEVRRLFTEYMVTQNLRKTPERYAILEVIYNAVGHFDVETLYIIMKNKKYRVSRATVYNTLDLLVECGLVVKHQFGSATAQFEKSYGYKQHDHLICNTCHKVLEFCDPRIQNIKNMVSEFYNFSIQSHTLQFYGECNNAQCEGKLKADKLKG
ncbi:MAG TPA: transcriptional repressor [Luteibaculaceae bacterium]|nr:transcriptional repressor [Luteibaculaceae bacterium]